MSYLFDTYALVELINKNPNYFSFKDEKIFTTILNLSEFYYYLIRVYDEKTADFLTENLNAFFIMIDKSHAIKSANFRYRNKKLKLSYTDCLGYILAKEKGLKFLTGDIQFKNMENVEFVK